MIVYHGSTLQIVHPDIAHSKRYLDFGLGFYVTSFQPQAEKWALRKGMRLSTTAVVNVYDFDMDAAGLSIRQFENEDGAWLDFVCDCRRGNETEAYDIIIGAVADDDVFKSVDMYVKGLWTRERTIQELRYYKRNDQIVFKNDSAIEKALRFRGSYEVKQND